MQLPMMMHPVTVMILLAFNVQAHKSRQNTTNRLAERLVDDLLERASTEHSAFLDSATLGKHGNVARPQVVASSRPSSLLPRPSVRNHPMMHVKQQLHSEEPFSSTGVSGRVIQSMPNKLADRRAVLSTLLAIGSLSSAQLTPPAIADGYRSAEDITLTDITGEKVTCPPGTFVPQRGKWDCLEITATADNQGGRVVSAASVYGRIRDADGNLVLSTALDEGMRASIASLGQTNKGKSQVKFILTVIANSPGPLKYEGFKAVYSNKNIEKQFQPFDPCELDPDSCAE
eukprot:gnl/MRDRNA2_/MRDRNA2_15102_c0_seq1.p1 gnl/MRDRNA2_/MRDRNA2_15102_c0~~gnl/MRDRNA2_/MRDRNA2_15102_c0_seq1.p1  ORF type:complete len:287 (-),score=37.12 gnl/MRDRNA2_/MRDRNA2_15102_c0_seq1:17-877(-)